MNAVWLTLAPSQGDLAMSYTVLTWTQPTRVPWDMDADSERRRIILILVLWVLWAVLVIGVFQIFPS
jgi:hypothetical protein